MRQVLVSLVQLGGMQFVIALTAVARNKVLALRLGTDGFGEFSQLALLAIAASVLVAFGLGMSLNRNVAAAGSAEERQRLLSQSNGVVLAMAGGIGLLAFATIALRPELLRLVGLEPRSSVVAALLVLLLYVPLEAAVKHRVAFLTAILDIRGMTAGRSTALVVGTIVSIPIVWYFGLVGAAVQLTLITACIMLLLDRRCRRIGYRPWGVRFEWTVVRFLAAFGIASLVAGFSQQLADLFVRSFLIRSTGASQNGVYQSALSITYQVKAIVLGSVGSYSIATLSQDASRERVIETAERLLAVVLPIGAVALAGLGLLSAPAVLILYSPEFLPAQELLPYLLTAEFVQVMIWVVGAPLLARGRVWTWLAFELLFSAARTVAAIVLIPRLGVTGVAVGYAAASLLHLVVTGGYYLVVFRYSISLRNLALFAAGGVLVASMAFLGARVGIDLPAYAGGLGAILLFALLSVQSVWGLREAWSRVRSRFSGEGGS